MKRLAPPAEEGLPLGPAMEPGLPACKAEQQTDHPKGTKLKKEKMRRRKIIRKEKFASLAVMVCVAPSQDHVILFVMSCASEHMLCWILQTHTQMDMVVCNGVGMQAWMVYGTWLQHICVAT